jgi:NAD(P)-dependent dehydrogenase (short-subunit alcohol dehydrogenase family)
VGRALLAAGRGGSIVNVSSQMGAVGYPGRAAYCASKHAVNGLTNSRRIPMGRIGDPPDVADAFVFLASDASRLVTGSILAVDGGWVAW